MNYKKIQFTYSQHINNNVSTAWEKHIFEETFNEFLIQSNIFQLENLKVNSYKDLIKHNENAIQLNNLLAARVIPSIELLNNNIFSVPDNLNTSYLQFTHFNVHIIQSNLLDKSKHYITINYISKPYHLIDCINDYYLVSKDISNEKIIETLMFPCLKNLSISVIHL
ncbi:hypothetical protein [Paenimyroides baculatum]|uniref:Uncharacterized protein n=1 Tax=Paenimyroides baculatum TaxID=2608000 RepID=A0A5M6CCT1_9FLAO|nr:hypothetical protein [Paenimyroides baculatum]KAA5532936.1 hypothetical protein F0460_12890 [Paenimyroides baculatum]